MVTKNFNELKVMAENILIDSGLKPEDAQTVVDTIMEAELSGVESHGLMRLKPYVERIRNDLINPSPNIQIAVDNQSIVVIDGDNGLGQVVANKTLDLAFDRLNTQSTFIATVRNSNHFGTCGYYTRKAAEKGYLAIAASNASPTMAPWGGKSPLLGTNPVAMSFPVGEKDNFTLDMATSSTAKGKIRTFERKDEVLPEGWAIDKAGYETTDAKAALDGSILPLGAHKGYGLSMFIDVICAGLSSASMSYETESMFKSNRIANIGHFFLFINLQDIVDPEQFNHRMKAWFNLLKESEKRPGFEEIFIPGEIENRKLSKKNDTISMNDKTYQELEELAK